MSLELKQLRGQTGYLELPGSTIPVYRMSDDEILLFDSGREPSPELMDLLEKEKLQVRAVVCTHLHEDHIANNEALVAKYGTRIYASALDILELQARETVSYPISAIEDSNELDIAGVSIGILPTPGHTDGHLAYVTPDGVCCVGDAIMTQKPLKRAKIPYMDDVDRSIISMEILRETAYPFYIVAHKGVISQTELRELVEENIQKELDLYELLRKQIAEPMEIEEVTNDFIRAAGVLSQKMLETNYVRHTARVRIFALVNAGEFSMEEGLIVPKPFFGHGARPC